MTAARLDHVVVVGGGLAASRACEELRAQDHRGRVTLVTEESHLPYDRPPLSKAVLLGQIHDTTLPVDYPALGVEIRTGVHATALQPAQRRLVTDAGDIAYDGLVLATGAVPVRLPGDGEQLTLRTIDDALVLRERLQPGARVVVIGASWIGAEVATAALARGCVVTCVEQGDHPLGGLFGEEVGQRIRGWWDGVDLRVQTAVEAVAGRRVELVDGTSLPADVVVTGAGVRPAVNWLADSGLAIDEGVATDEWLRAAPGVAAVGDVATWWSRRYRRRMRVEHWDDAAAGAAVAVASLLATTDDDDREPHDPVPYFWSDQFGQKLQYVGRHERTDTLIWRDRPDGSWTALWVDDNQRLSAALAVDLPRESAQAQTAIRQRLVLDPSALQDPALPIPKALAG